MASNEQFGVERSLGKTVVIDWLTQPFAGFTKQILEGHEPETCLAARQSIFEQWSLDGLVLDVVDHVNGEVLWFGGDMWIRACREIEKNHTAWGRPLGCLTTLSNYLTLAHIHLRTLDPAHRAFHEAYSVQHAWFQPARIPGKTHFPTLESPAEVVASIMSFCGA